jgi:hypothetical protein
MIDTAYSNTTIILSEPDANWGKNPSMHHQSCAESVTTPDGGKTWKIGTIHMKESTAPKDYTSSPRPDGPAICPGGRG